MAKTETKSSNLQNSDHVIDTAIKLAVLALIIAWCVQILRPFVNIVIWAVIIAITLFPVYQSLKSRLGDRAKLSAFIITVLFLAILIIPSVFLTDSLIEGIKNFSENLSGGNFVIPPPPDKVSDWPVIGKSVASVWQAASTNLEGLVINYKENLVNIGQWIVRALLGTGKGLLQFLGSIIIAGILLTGSDTSSKRISALFKKLAGTRGQEFQDTSIITIRNVVKGILGVAFIQSLLLGVIFLLAGIPYAGLWALLCLIFAVIQIGPILVNIPVVIYLFVNHDPWYAILFTIIIVLASLIDNVLKPLLMGKGATVPMLVIFLGAIGGFIASGFLGLFIGAIVLSLGYKLYSDWLKA